MSQDEEQEKVADIRRDYTRQALDEATVEADPIEQFKRWFEEALSADILDPNAMTLATASEEGQPSARIVLLKGVDEQGFRFYSNYQSRKGKELEENPQAALCFFWSPLERQVRIEGTIEKLSRADSEAYFRQRPRLSQLGAWTSRQSQNVASRKALEASFAEIRQRFEDQEVPLPDFWGGYLVRPKRMEFWQGRSGRLHDRLCYEYEKDEEAWNIFRLAP